MSKNYLHKDAKKSNKKPMMVYAITNCHMCDYEGMSFDGHEIISAFFSKKVAENELVKYLKCELEEDVSIENLHEYLDKRYYEFGASYSVVEIEVNDKTSIK